MTVLAFAGSLTRPAPNYAHANGQGITSFEFDPETGQFTELALYRGVDDSTWLVVVPETRCLYALCEVAGSDQSWVVAFGFDAAGKLTEKNRQPTEGQTACHASLTPDGRFLVVANYNAEVTGGQPDAAVTVFPIGADGCLEPASDRVDHTGRGPNPERQTRSHAHCAMVSGDGRFVYVADLGIDRILVYRLDAHGRLTSLPDADLVIPKGAGPRHVDLSPDGRWLFAISELEPIVFSAAIAPDTGALRLVDTYAIADTGIRSQPSGLIYDDATSCLYAGLRGSDEILCLQVDRSSGQLGFEDRWPCGGPTPRDIAFAPGRGFVVAANQDADRLTVFRTGAKQQRTPQHTQIKTPMAIAFAVIRS